MSPKSQVAKASNWYSKLIWLLVAIIVAVGVVGNYYYSASSLLYRVLALLALAAVASYLVFQTAKGKVFWHLLKEARSEIRKVVWPTRQETTQTTLIVVVFVIIMGLILWGIDSLLGWIVSSFIGT